MTIRPLLIRQIPGGLGVDTGTEEELTRKFNEYVANWLRQEREMIERHWPETRSRGDTHDLWRLLNEE